MTPEDPEEIPLLLRPGGSAPRGRHLFLAAFAASLGSLSFGIALGYSSPAIPSLRRSAAPAPRLDDSTASWFGVYISEIAYPAIRGLLGAFVQLMVVTGILFAYLAGWVLEWHWLAVLGCGPPTLMLLLMWCMPETPRFLLSQHKLLEARSAMCFLWGSEADWEEPPIGAEYQGFQLTLLRHPGIYKPFIIGISLMAFQQLSGINAIMFYTETIFEEAKFKNSNLASVIVGAIQVLFTGIAALIMDRAGRRLLLILSGFALGWGPIPWLLMSEIFPLHIKGMATGVCVLTNWLMAFLVTKEFSTLMEALRPCGTFWLASGFCICSVLFTWFCVPETKGKTLEQITAHFEGR